MDEREYDAQTLERLAERYRSVAADAGVDPRDVTIGQALDYLQTGTVPSLQW
jgi:hypothetical protein